MTDKAQKEISWRAAEYEFKEKGPAWYSAIGFVAAVIIVLAFVGGNFFFAVFVLVASITLMFFGGVKPQVFNFRVNEEGVEVGERKTHHYEDLEGFAVFERPNRLDELILKKKTNINPYVKIPVDSKAAREAKEILGAHLPEIEYQESLIDIFSDLLRF